MHPRVSLLSATGFFKMFSLNPREQMCVVALLVATVLGMTIRYWREARRESVAAPLPHGVLVTGIQPATSGGEP